MFFVQEIEEPYLDSFYRIGLQVNEFIDRDKSIGMFHYDPEPFYYVSIDSI